MIRIENLTVQFGGVKPIDGLSVTLDKAIVGLIGPNGAGKTTLLNVLSGFVTPVSGSVAVNGVVISDIAPHKRAHMGLRRTFQTDQIADDLTLWENVQAIADHAAYSTQVEAQKDVQRAIDYVGLGKRIHRIPAYCGAQVFLIDHDVALIVACCEETMVLDFGKLLALGPTKDVLEQPEVRRAYLGDFEAMEIAA